MMETRIILRNGGNFVLTIKLLMP